MNRPRHQHRVELHRGPSGRTGHPARHPRPGPCSRSLLRGRSRARSEQVVSSPVRTDGNDSSTMAREPARGRGPDIGRRSPGDGPSRRPSGTLRDALRGRAWLSRLLRNSSAGRRDRWGSTCTWTGVGDAQPEGHGGPTGCPLVNGQSLFVVHWSGSRCSPHGRPRVTGTCRLQRSARQLHCTDRWTQKDCSEPAGPCASEAEGRGPVHPGFYGQGAVLVPASFAGQSVQQVFLSRPVPWQRGHGHGRDAAQPPQLPGPVALGEPDRRRPAVAPFSEPSQVSQWAGASIHLAGHPTPPPRTGEHISASGPAAALSPAPAGPAHAVEEGIEQIAQAPRSRPRRRRLGLAP